MAREHGQALRLSIPVGAVPKEVEAALRSMSAQRRRAFLIRIVRAGLESVGAEIQGVKPGAVAGPFRGFIRWL